MTTKHKEPSHHRIVKSDLKSDRRRLVADAAVGRSPMAAPMPATLLVATPRASLATCTKPRNDLRITEFLWSIISLLFWELFSTWVLCQTTTMVLSHAIFLVVPKVVFIQENFLHARYVCKICRKTYLTTVCVTVARYVAGKPLASPFVSAVGLHPSSFRVPFWFLASS